MPSSTLAPVFIPSVGRADVAKAPRSLLDDGIDITLVVEPHEVGEYAAHFPEVELIVLPESGRGMWYVREFMRKYALAHLTEPYYWMVDDNIRGLKWLDMTAERYGDIPWGYALDWMTARTMEHPTVMISGPTHQQFGWAAKKPWRYNTRVTSCMLLRVDAPAEFREPVSTKEDLDFALQLLTAGLDSMLFHQVGMNKPTLGKNAKGGCMTEYRAGRDLEAIGAMCGLWPEYAEPTVKFGRQDVKVNWRAFRREVPRKVTG